MANDIKKDVDEIESLKADYEKAYYSEFIDLICNAIIIEGEDIAEDVPNNFILKTGVENGRIGVFNKMWLPVTDTGNVNVYGVSESYSLQGANGVNFENNDIKVINFTPSAKGLKNWLKLQCRRLAEIETSIICNLYAIRDSVLLLVDDDKNKETLKTAWRARAVGVPAIAVTKGYKEAFDSINVKVDFQCDKLEELRAKTKREILSRMGIVSGADKKERVQSFDMPVNEAIDSIYVIIDTFNNECIKKGVKASAKLNGSIEELYNNDESGAVVNE